MWDRKEAVAWYKRQGAPADQTALVELLRELQSAHGGSIPPAELAPLARELGTKESLLLALIRRLPSLRLAGKNVLEICGGKTCAGQALAAWAQETYGSGVEVRLVPCMRLCGKGPNIKWNGKLCHGADRQLIRTLADQK